MTDKSGREQSVERDFGKSASCHFSVYRSYFPRYGFQQDNFSVLFSFDIFLFLEAVVKAALFVVGEVGAIQVVINPSPVYLRHLRLIRQSRRKSTRLPVATSPKGRLRTFPLPSLSSIGGFYTPASLRFLLSDCMACNQIFYFFIRICLFSVYLHFDAVFTVSHPLVVPVQAQR